MTLYICLFFFDLSFQLFFIDLLLGLGFYRFIGSRILFVEAHDDGIEVFFDDFGNLSVGSTELFVLDSIKFILDFEVWDHIHSLIIFEEFSIGTIDKIFENLALVIHTFNRLDQYNLSISRLDMINFLFLLGQI